VGPAVGRVLQQGVEHFAHRDHKPIIRAMITRWMSDVPE
jgi:hypothetical protein